MAKRSAGPGVELCRRQFTAHGDFLFDIALDEWECFRQGIEETTGALSSALILQN
jgi:hypothetical protein